MAEGSISEFNLGALARYHGSSAVVTDWVILADSEYEKVYCRDLSILGKIIKSTYGMKIATHREECGAVTLSGGKQDAA